jgi:hypothetical protein
MRAGSCRSGCARSSAVKRVWPGQNRTLWSPDPATGIANPPNRLTRRAANIQFKNASELSCGPNTAESR